MSLRASILLLVFSAGCGLTGDEAGIELTASIDLPGNGGTLDNPETDETIELMPSGSGSMVKAEAGDELSVAVPFNAPNGNVIGAGIRFGDTGPIRTVPVGGAMGSTSGTLRFNAAIPSDICNKLSKVCHDIKCYEFAVTSAGRVSRANITSMAMLCGNCDEPSCKGLVDPAACETPPVGGSISCSQAGLVSDGEGCCSDYSGSTSSCSIDYCIVLGTSGCTRSYYKRGSTKFRCSSCQDLNSCASAAVASCR
jgi:LSD1 subclass zinc finger protein